MGELRVGSLRGSRRLFAKCLKAKNWPGYPKNPQLLSPPDWLIRNRMFRNFGKFEEAA
jgi:hypothetical protein